MYDKEDKVTEPGTEHVWFYGMDSDGYSLDDKRNKSNGYGDLQDIVTKFKKRDARKDTDRTQKWFMVPRQEIVDEKYELSLTRYKEEVFEEIEYEKPEVILRKLIESEVGKDFDENALSLIQGGIVKELLELKGMLG
ncbi:conserved domain protein [delta proteobacterium NaphS2]|nr:conserved domain protein [delta proteobacterium NaphS2]